MNSGLPIVGIPLRASMAARQIGCSADTIKREIERGNLRGYRGPDGRFYTTDVWLRSYFRRLNPEFRP